MKKTLQDILYVLEKEVDKHNMNRRQQSSFAIALSENKEKTMTPSTLSEELNLDPVSVYVAFEVLNLKEIVDRLFISSCSCSKVKVKSSTMNELRNNPKLCHSCNDTADVFNAKACYKVKEMSSWKK